MEDASSLVAIMEEQVGIRGWNSQYSSLFSLWIDLIYIILEQAHGEEEHLTYLFFFINLNKKP